MKEKYHLLRISILYWKKMRRGIIVMENHYIKLDKQWFTYVIIFCIYF